MSAASLSGRVVLGRYRIVAPLARGGMGIIYLGRLEGAAGFAKPVVIKTVIPDARDDKIAQLFAREARILSNLEHPSIVGVLDFGEAENQYVMVLEYVHGFHLGFWSRYVQKSRGKMLTEHAVEVMLPALDALDFAHGLTRDGAPLGIVHRDVSPANILIDQLGHVKLHDFGIARMADDEFKTQDGTFRGTLSFTAPETLQGIPASPRSDLYACGVILYQLLAGSNPFKGQQPSETLHRVMTHVPPRLRSLRSDVNEAVDAAIMRALEKDPEKRFDSAGSFAEALRAARSWPEEATLRELERVIHDDFTGPEMATALGLETLQTRDAAWRASSKDRSPLSSSPPGPASPHDVVTQSGQLQGAGGPDGNATIQALPSSSLLELAREGADQVPTVAPARPAPELVTTQPAPAPRRGGLVLGLTLGTLALGGGAFVMLRPTQAPPPPRYLLIEKQADPSPSADVSVPSSSAAATPDGTTLSSARPQATAPKAAKPSDAPATGSSLTAAFQRQRPRVQACFAQQPNDASGQPQLTIRFQVEASGAVKSAELIPASLGGTALGQCILGIARSTRFPAGDAGVSFTIPITARKSGG